MSDKKTTAEPSGADGGYPPVPPAYATAPERRVMARFLRVFDLSGGRFACGLVGTPAMDIRFLQEHPTREDADFCCYMLAKAIVFSGQSAGSHGDQCRCGLATRLVGDGCEHCNPAMTIDILREQVAEMRLTDAEREAISAAACICEDAGRTEIAVSINTALERLG